MIVALLSLLTAVIAGCLISLFFICRKFDAKISQAQREAKAYSESLAGIEAHNRERQVNHLREEIKTVQANLEELKLDYTEAQSAANHINDFAVGLANIFDYDPVEARRQQKGG